MKAESIRSWVKEYSFQETMEMITGGEVITFEAEGISTSDPMVLSVIQTAYLFFQIEEDRRSERTELAYVERVKAGKYSPGLLLGYEPYTFQPSIELDEVAVVVEAFRAAADGVGCGEIAEWILPCHE